MNEYLVRVIFKIQIYKKKIIYSFKKTRYNNIYLKHKNNNICKLLCIFVKNNYGRV